jgi:hypothetical protein
MHGAPARSSRHCKRRGRAGVAPPFGRAERLCVSASAVGLRLMRMWIVASMSCCARRRPRGRLEAARTEARRTLSGHPAHGPLARHFRVQRAAAAARWARARPMNSAREFSDGKGCAGTGTPRKVHNRSQPSPVRSGADPARRRQLPPPYGAGSSPSSARSSNRAGRTSPASIHCCMLEFESDVVIRLSRGHGWGRPVPRSRLANRVTGQATACHLVLRRVTLVLAGSPWG